MDTSRVVVHFDCDAFYAQCEEVRDPSLRTRPLGELQPGEAVQNSTYNGQGMRTPSLTDFRTGCKTASWCRSDSEVPYSDIQLPCKAEGCRKVDEHQGGAAKMP